MFKHITTLFRNHHHQNKLFTTTYLMASKSRGNTSLNFHTFNLYREGSNNLSTILRERAGLSKKELELFEQLHLDESDLEELKNQISETSYQLAMERFHRIVNNKCVFVERDESVDLSKFSIKLVEFASTKVSPQKKHLSTPNEQELQKQPEKKSLPILQQQNENVSKQKISSQHVSQESTIVSKEEHRPVVVKETIVEPVQQQPFEEEEPSSISALAQEQINTTEEEEPEEEKEEKVKKTQFQLPTESYSTWDKETTLYVMKGLIRKGGAGMKPKQIQCLKQFEINGRVLESVKISLEKETKQVVIANLMTQLSIPNYKPTTNIVSKIVDWVETHTSQQ